MALLFHPSLGRFTHPDEAGASGTDSDSYYGHSQRRAVYEQRTRREEGNVGNPGSRRHQRHLNNTFAEYVSYTYCAPRLTPCSEAVLEHRAAAAHDFESALSLPFLLLLLLLLFLELLLHFHLAPRIGVRIRHSLSL